MVLLGYLSKYNTSVHRHGGLEDLKKTTNFITAAGLVVWANEKKKGKSPSSRTQKQNMY